MFNRISGTTAISGAVDTSLTLVEERRGSRRAKLFCVGRDIEYREMELERNGDNIWEVVSDSRDTPELLEDRIVPLLSELMKGRKKFIGTPTELTAAIDPVGTEGISPKTLSRRIVQSVEALIKAGITVIIRRSNGRRLIELHRADSADKPAPGKADPVDPAAAVGEAQGLPIR